eukprot:m.150240 g.150240  ORF g.150240 m.150240 type:complete len:433 (+) comp30715_c2_seq5:233-1531(+)
MHPFWGFVVVVVLLNDATWADVGPKLNMSATPKERYIQIQKSRYAQAAFTLESVDKLSRRLGRNANLDIRKKHSKQQQYFAEVALKKIGYNFDKFAVAVAEHYKNTDVTSTNKHQPNRSLFGHSVEYPFPLCEFMQDWNLSRRPEFNNVYLLGERNSGTNFVASVVGRHVENISVNALSSRPKFKVVSRFSPSYSHIPVLGYKHMFRGTLLNESELQTVRETSKNGALWLLVVRNPCDWVDGMYRKPWHICNPTDKTSGGCDPYPKGVGENKRATRNMTRLEFLKTSWVDWAQWFVQRMHNPEEYRTPTPDWSSATYSNIFKLRTFKLRLMLQIMEAVPRNVKVVHLDHLELSTERFLYSINTEFNISRTGSKASIAHPHKREMCLTDDEWQVAQAGLDWDVESKFGFSRFDCHTCINPDPPSCTSGNCTHA